MSRTFDTMSEAIAMSSPSGSMSKRARKAANERLRRALFSDGLVVGNPHLTLDEERAILLQRAGDLRRMAAAGMKPRAFVKEAERLEAQARNT